MQVICVDVLNFTNRFFGKPETWSNMKIPCSRIRNFVKSATYSGFRVVAFLDDCAVSEEALAKTKERQVRNIHKGARRVPQGSTAILGDIFERCGCSVHYSKERDNDDTLAYYASVHYANAVVLSADKDFFRYTGHTYKVYENFRVIIGGGLELVEKPPPMNPSSERVLPDSCPATTGEMRFVSGGKLSKGVPTPLLKQLGISPHRVLQPLRKALYASLKVSRVIESYPEWNEDTRQVTWCCDKVDADLKLDYLLRKPLQALDYFFPYTEKPKSVTDEDWSRHNFCMKSLVFEICAEAQGRRLLDLFLEFS